MIDRYTLTRGTSPLIISMPHSGVELGPFAALMTDTARLNTDCDWHLPRLYSFLPALGATVLQANYSRYVVDLNRDPSGKSLYAGQNVTELCPTTTFDEAPIYEKGRAPNSDEVLDRVDAYWMPYHDALNAEIQRVRNQFGYALLWDAHSIRSQVPRFFEGHLPDFNIGTNEGKSCAASLAESVVDAIGQNTSYSSVHNGRFKGGYITRQYGQPERGVHAVQLELSQTTYMDENYPYAFLPEKAKAVRPVILAALEAMLNWQPHS
ncbi:MAG: N-formylglutamate deformylase [Kordiimonadaceae bacterium]|nr:N-formylglutamate deformylase [Kordiimonadaceae bacterium]